MITHNDLTMILWNNKPKRCSTKFTAWLHPSCLLSMTKGVGSRKNTRDTFASALKRIKSSPAKNTKHVLHESTYQLSVKRGIKSYISFPTCEVEALTYVSFLLLRAKKN